MSNPLDAASLLQLLPDLLPRSTSSPLPRPTDALSALVHAIHTALQFRLIYETDQTTSTSTPTEPLVPSAQPTHDACGASAADAENEADIDDGASETTTAVDAEEDDVPTSNTAENRLREGWNSRAEDNYTFLYKHEQSAMTFRVRVGRMGGRAQVDAMAEDGAPHSFSVVLADIINAAAFPIPSPATASAPAPAPSTGSGSADIAASSTGFKSLTSVNGFVEQYKRDIIARILPGLQVPGYQESRSAGSDPRNPPPSAPTHQPSPARPNVPSPIASYDPLRDIHGGSNPASLGRRDLDPFISPPSAFNPNRDGGGMLMDFNHPLFDSRRQGQGQGRDSDLYGPGGSIQPPGARWDPIGPSAGGNPRFPGPGGNPLGGMGVGDDRWGDELPPPGEFGPDLGRFGGRGMGGPRQGGPPGFGGGLGGFGGGFGGGGGSRGGGGGGGFGGFGGGGGGMYM